MSKKHRQAGRRNGGGRPRKDGPRYSSGALKPPQPNATVVSTRRALLGAEAADRVDISKAENRLDLALASGWLLEGDHRDARAYAALFYRTGVEVPRIAGVVGTSAGFRLVRDLMGIGRGSIFSEAA